MFDFLKRYALQILGALAFAGIGAAAHMSASDVKDGICSGQAKDIKPLATPAPEAK